MGILRLLANNHYLNRGKNARGVHFSPITKGTGYFLIIPKVIGSRFRPALALQLSLSYQASSPGLGQGFKVQRL